MSRLAGLVASIRTEGLGRTLRVALHRAHAARWERRLGVVTGGDHLLASEGLASPDHHDHSASSVWDVRRALDRSGVQPEGNVLVDFGSGKGRVLLVAAERPFRRIIGIELSPTLADISRRNLEAASPRLRCRDVEVHAIGADRFEVPADASLLYFYNPFGGAVMNTVIASLRRSLIDHPRAVTIIVATPPRFEQSVTGLGWVKKRHEWMGLRRHAIFDCTQPATDE